MSLGVFDVVYINPPYKRDTFLKKEAPTMGQGTSGHSYIYHNGTKYLVTQTTNHSISTTGAPHSVQKQPAELSCLPLDELISPMTGFE